MRISKILQVIFILLLENIIILGTIVFSIVILLKSQTLQLTEKQLLLYAISLIGLLSISMFIEKIIKLQRIEFFTNKVYNFLIKKDGTPSLDLLMKKRSSQPSIEERLDVAREIFITGGSLNRITSEYLGYFENKAEEGGKLKFLLVDPECEAAKLLIEHVVYEVDDFRTYSHQLENSISCLLRIKNNYCNNIDIRVCKQVPPFGLIIADPNKNNGSITVELYGSAQPARKRASFYVIKDKEPESFQYFLNQFDLMWDKSREIT